MTLTSTRSLLALAVAPLLLLGSFGSVVETDAGYSTRAPQEARLELAMLKAEARSLTVHIDGP